LPVLVYVAGIPAHEAVGVSLVVVGGTSLVGSLLNARRGSLDLKAGAFFAVSGLAGAFVGAKFTRLLSASALLFLFGGLMLAVGARMLLKKETDTPPQRCRPWRCLGVGLTVGVLTGFLGVGGGFLILPALVLFAGVEMKRAIGTSLAVIAVNCLGGLVGQLRYVRLDWLLTLAFLTAALAGMFAGAALAGRFPGSTLRPAFAWCVLGLGAVLVAWNGAALVGAP
ncbi:MAG: sulfite exporter TauE/SafE family protein, partial [Verrucomicrobia bacterium]|nr:sulfite exporter TauE/SafE family protein [Verrucomicrobiota bacterium]